MLHIALQLSPTALETQHMLPRNLHEQVRATPVRQKIDAEQPPTENNNKKLKNITSLNVCFVNTWTHYKI